jgi:nitrous oxide reductase accessory protein NosL
MKLLLAVMFTLVITGGCQENHYATTSIVTDPSRIEQCEVCHYPHLLLKGGTATVIFTGRIKP